MSAKVEFYTQIFLGVKNEIKSFPETKTEFIVSRYILKNTKRSSSRGGIYDSTAKHGNAGGNEEQWIRQTCEET